MRGILNVLNVVLEHAVKHEYIASNPVRKLNGEKPPARNRTRARILEAEEVGLLIHQPGEGTATLIVTAAYTGMRQSELLGLRWVTSTSRQERSTCDISSPERPRRGPRGSCR